MHSAASHAMMACPPVVSSPAAFAFVATFRFLPLVVQNQSQ